MNVRDFNIDSVLSGSTSSLGSFPTKWHQGSSNNLLDEIRQSLSKPHSKNVKRFQSYIGTSSLVSPRHGTDIIDSYSSSFLGDIDETKSDIGDVGPPLKSNPLKPGSATDDNTNNMTKEGGNILKEFLGYFDILDDDRVRTAEELTRLKNLTTELSKILKESNSREQQNFNELKKQRKLLIQWEENFKRIKEEAQQAIVTLLDQREKIKAKLLEASGELKKFSLENDQLKTQLLLEEQKAQSLKKFRDLYTVNEKEKKQIASEFELLVLQNTKLSNECNAIEAERHRLQALVDELQSGRTVQANAHPEPRAPAPMNGNSADSPFEQLYEEDIKQMVRNFDSLPEDKKLNQYTDLLDQLRHASSNGELYWRYTQALMEELDRR